MKIFVSSTIYDLIDIRSEIYELLKASGLNPSMSDRGDSDFTQIPTSNSIDTCLVNLRSSDYCIVILSQRYGASLSDALPQYGDVSATHLEYNTAIEENLNVLFYVRDRLHSEFDLWRRHKMPNDLTGLSLVWTPLLGLNKKPNALPLFRFLASRWILNSQHSRNWIQTFTSSNDLKRLISNDLSIQFNKSNFRNSIIKGDLPSLILNYDVSGTDSAGFLVSLQLSNPSQYPAYSISVVSEVLGSELKYHYMAPSDKWCFANLDVAPGSASIRISLAYHTALGFLISEYYIIMFSISHHGYLVISIERDGPRSYTVPIDLRDQFTID